jgi:hypothetical protein
LGICASLLDPEAKDSFIQEMVFIGCNALTGTGYILGHEGRCKVLQNRYLWDRSHLPQILETPLLMLHVVAGPY